MPDFVAVKELVEQQVDSYRCSGASLVQAFYQCPLLQLQAVGVLVPSSMAPFCLLILVMKNLEKHLEICACPVAVCYFSLYL